MRKGTQALGLSFAAFPESVAEIWMVGVAGTYTSTHLGICSGLKDPAMKCSISTLGLRASVGLPEEGSWCLSRHGRSMGFMVTTSFPKAKPEFSQDCPTLF